MTDDSCVARKCAQENCFWASFLLLDLVTKWFRISPDTKSLRGSETNPKITSQHRRRPCSIKNPIRSILPKKKQTWRHPHQQKNNSNSTEIPMDSHDTCKKPDFLFKPLPPGKIAFKSSFLKTTVVVSGLLLSHGSVAKMVFYWLCKWMCIHHCLDRDLRIALMNGWWMDFIFSSQLGFAKTKLFLDQVLQAITVFPCL